MSEPDALRVVREAAYENPRPEVAQHVPVDARRILDLGCSSGALGAALKRAPGAPADREVVGIELDAAYAADARRRLDRVVEGDLEALAASDAALADLGRFDVLVAGDVLEHLREPEVVLRRFASLLPPGGVVVVSLPNVRHWETFWQLGIRGTWPRRSMGIFDRTHLRWFTLRDAHALLDAADVDVTEVRRELRMRPEGASNTRPSLLLARTPARTFVTFQHVLAGRRR